MNKFCKMLLAAAAMMALAAPAMAADKLVVKDSAGATNVFTIDDTGAAVGMKFGANLGGGTPKAPIHLNLNTGAGVTPPIGTTLYSAATGFALSTQDNSPSADFITADGLGIAGYRGMLRGVRSRGTLAAPTIPSVDDYVMSVLGAVWTGQRIWNTADIAIKVDGTVSDGGTTATAAGPTRITFSTRPLGTTWYERMAIKSDGKIIIGVTAMPVYENNAAAASLAAGTLYRTSAGVLMIKY